MNVKNLGRKFASILLLLLLIVGLFTKNWIICSVFFVGCFIYRKIYPETEEEQEQRIKENQRREEQRRIDEWTRSEEQRKKEEQSAKIAWGTTKVTWNTIDNLLNKDYVKGYR
ncbi:hypothetical protein [Coleofasciculus sp. FACHB-129]|uniref:hypothetical protein n=1 Tax=Cyanophyceae TaxID=3028117 RepID=UPI00168204C0|nr:hypothetical protein [Coleofasciculus sp. FACHB-129]MBD1895710.1 hypothetical protein [Coleofasciculus sp. FACHB-129]